MKSRSKSLWWVNFRWLLLLLLQPLAVRADQRVIDSLNRLLAVEKSDSVRMSLHTQLANQLITSDYSKALKHAQTAVQLAEASGKTHRMIKAYKVAGSVCMYMGLNELAVDYYIRFNTLAEKMGDKAEIGAARFNLASTDLALNEFTRAEKLLLEADTLLREGYREKNQPLPPIITVMFRKNLANIYMNLGAYRKSDSMIALCMPMVENVPGMEDKLESLYHIQALIYLKLKDPDGALASLSKSRELAIRLKDDAGYTAIFQSTGQAYELKGDEASAIKEYSEGFRSAERINQLAMQVILSESLYKLYRKKGMGDSSIRYFELFTRLSEESKSETARQALSQQDLMRTFRKMESDLMAREGKDKQRRFYQSIGLYILLLTAVGGAVVYRRRYRRLRLEKVRRDLESRRMQLEEKRLQAKLGQKDEELARIHYELSKNALLEALSGLNSPSDDETVRDFPGRQDSKKTTNTFNGQSRAWEEFEFRFQQIHSGFYDRLSHRFPDLTLNERRLCAFLKLDMTTKEISAITGQSIRAVEIARTRLRKKLNLGQMDTSLFGFLSSL